jgi:hypothetical protein
LLTLSSPQFQRKSAEELSSVLSLFDQSGQSFDQQYAALKEKFQEARRNAAKDLEAMSR